MTLSLTPSSGLFRGGRQVTFFGNELDMSACADDFADGSLSPIWTDISSGSGTVVEDATLRALILDTGTTPGSAAGVQTVDQVLDVDVEAVFQLDLDDRTNRRATGFYAELGLRVPGSDSGLRFRIKLVEQTRFLNIETRASGVQTSNVETLIARQIALGAQATLRILRADQRVLLFRNGELFFEFDWYPTLVQIEIVVRNDPILTSRARSQVRTYTRRPVIVFGTAPIRDLNLRGLNRALGTAPSVGCEVDTVDIKVTGCTGSPSIVTDGFTFARESDLIRFEDRGTELVLCNDLTLTKGRGT